MVLSRIDSACDTYLVFDMDPPSPKLTSAAAFTLVLQTEIESRVDKITHELLQEIQEHFTQAPWRKLLERALRIEKSDALDALTLQVTTGVQQGFLVVAELKVPLSTVIDMPTESEAKDPTSEAYSYFFDHFLSVTKFWKETAAPRIEEIRTNFKMHVGQVSIYQATAKKLLQDLEFERAGCEEKRLATIARCNVISADADLKDLRLEAVIQGFIAACAKSEQLLAGDTCTSAVINNNVLALVNTPLAQLDNLAVVNCGFWVKYTVLSEHHLLNHTFECSSPTYFDPLKLALQTSHTSRGYYLQFIKNYGADITLALAALTTKQIVVFFELYSGNVDFAGYWEAKVLKGGDFSGLNRCILAAVKAVPLDSPLILKNFLDARDAVKEVVDGSVTIALPKGVKALGWRLIGKLWYPRGFESGALISTDQLCLKHAAEETGGAAATKQKLEAYFAQCVEACEKAGTKWSEAGKPMEFKAKIELKRGNEVVTWRIIVKNNGGKPQVFHVDSSYAKSPWASK